MLVQSLHHDEWLEISFAGRVIGKIVATQHGRTVLACDFPREYQIRRAGDRLKLAANVMLSVAGTEIPDCGNGGDE